MNILRNFSFLTAAHLVEKLITFIIVIILARYLGVENYGVYALALSFVGLFGNLFDGGLNLLLMREMSKENTDRPKLFGHVLAGKIFLGFIILVVIILLAIALGYQQTVLLSIIIYGVSMFFLSFSNTFRSIFIAMGRTEFEGLLLVLNRLLLLGGIILFAILSIKIPWIITAHLIAVVIVVILGAYLCKKFFFAPLWNRDYQGIKKLFKEAIPFAIGAIMGEIFFNIDNVMLSKMVGMESVGYYNAAYKLSFSGMLFANTLTLVTYPYFSRMWTEDKDNVFKMFNGILKALIVISVAFALSASILSENIIALVFGEQYRNSVVLFNILVWSVPPLYIMHLTGRALEAIGEQRFTANTMLISVAINILLNFILILKYGAAGASIATVFTSFLIVAIHMLHLKKKMGFSVINMPIVKVGICLTGLAAIILLLKDFNWYIAAVAGFIVYCGMLILLKVLVKEDIIILIGRDVKRRLV